VGGLGGLVQLLGDLRNKLTSKGLEIISNCTAVALISNDQDSVVGLRCHKLDAQDYLDIQAPHVCLATGGFAANQQLMAEHLPQQADLGCVCSAATGDGLTLARAAGALDYLPVAAPPLTGWIPEALLWGLFTPSLAVLPNAARFVNEEQPKAVAQAVLAAGFSDWWQILTPAAREQSQIKASLERVAQSYPQRLVEAASIEELAAAMQLDADALAATLAQRNELAAAGQDSDFGASAHFTVLEPPFIGLRQSVRRYLSSGGLLTSRDSEVLKESLLPIWGLYAAGALVAWTQSDLALVAGSGYLAGQAILYRLDNVTPSN